MEEPVDVLIEDGEGVTMKMTKYDGHFYPVFPTNKKVLPMLKTFEARPDDIFIVTFPKSGTTWCRTLVSELLGGQQSKRGFLEFTTQDDLNAMTSPRIVFTHITPDVMSLDVFKKKCKIVFVVRNVKDAIVSLYGHYPNMKMFEYAGTFSGFVGGEIKREGLEGSWFKHLRSWEQFFADHPETPVIYLQYEDMKQDTLREVKRLCDFLHLTRDDEFCKQVVEKCSFGNMQSRDKKNPMIPIGMWRDNKSVFFRKGEVGDWINWFTVAQSERIDEIYKKEMQGSKFTFKYHP